MATGTSAYDAGRSERCVSAEVGGRVLHGVASERPAAVNTLVPPTGWAGCQRDWSASDQSLAA